MRRRRSGFSFGDSPTTAVLAAVVGVDLGATITLALLLKRLAAVVRQPAEKVSEVAGALVGTD